MVLVVDVVKGVQTQTAECLVIGEIICNKMLVVLNKIDLIPSNKKQVSNFYLSHGANVTVKIFCIVEIDLPAILFSQLKFLNCCMW